MDQYSRVHAQMILGMLFLIVISSCSASRNTYAVQSQNSNSKQSSEVVNVPPSQMVKDAIRLQGILLSDLGKSNGWYQYEFRVNKTIKYGATFASIEPASKEEVVLNTAKKLAFETGSGIILDVTTPRDREVGKLMIFKVSE